RLPGTPPPSGRLTALPAETEGSLGRLSLWQRSCQHHGRSTHHPLSGDAHVRDQVEETIQAIRPAIQADNGDIMLIDVAEDSGVVTVELIGACVSCPASTVTLKAGIERILKDRVPGVTEVINSGETLNAIGETAVSL